MLKEAGKGLRALRRALRPVTLHGHHSSPFGPGAALPAGWHFLAWLWMPDAVTAARCPGDTSLPSSSPPLPPTEPPSFLPTCPGYPCPGPPPAQVAMPGTSSALWVLLAQVLQGTLIFNFLSKPLTGESSAWHGGAADAGCDPGDGRQAALGRGRLGWGTQPSAASHGCAAPRPRRAGERWRQMCACPWGGREERQRCCPDGEAPPGPLAAQVGQGADAGGGEPTLSLALADTAARVAAPAEGACRDGASPRAAPRAAGPESFHPCGPLKGSQGIAVWRKLPACPGEGEL